MNVNERKRLLNVTERLYKYNQLAEEQYLDKTMSKDYEVDFYKVVKPFADEVHAVAEEWKELASLWVRQEDPDFLSPNQIQDTYDNIIISSVIAFQVKTRKRKLLNTTASITYILDIVISHLKNVEI